VLADVDAPTLFGHLLGDVPEIRHIRRDLRRFQWDSSTLKMNWALSRPVQWRADRARTAGTVHFGVDLDGFVEFATDLSLHRFPRNPFVLFGQMTTADPTRSPAGTESAWAYTHVPHSDVTDLSGLQSHEKKVEHMLDQLAPGFLESILARHTQLPADLQAADSNLVDGAINGGTAYPHQQLIFRPTPGLGRPETPIAGLFLASASAHPGGGVHGACGWNAATAALNDAGPARQLRERLIKTAWGRLLGPEDR